MKKICFILLPLLCVKGFCQEPTIAQQKALYKKIDSLLYNYLKYSSFLTNGERNVNSAAVNNYTNLFMPGTNIPNDVLPAYFYGDTIHPSSMRKVTLSSYASSVQNNYPTGFIVTPLYVDIDLTGLTQKTARAIVVKRLDGFSKDGLNVQNKVTLLLGLQINDDYKSVKISGVEEVDHAFALVNDADGDFIADEKDPCPSLYDIHTWSTTGKATGCRTDWEIRDSLVYVECLNTRNKRLKAMTDSANVLQKASNASTDVQKSLEDKIGTVNGLISSPPHLWFSVAARGGIVSSNITNATNLPNSQVLTTSFNPQTALGFDAQLAYFFGKDASFGIGAGISYTTFTGKLTLDRYRTSIYDSLTDAKRPARYLTQNISLGASTPQIVENVTLNSLGIPITIIYKGKLSLKADYQVEGGIIYNLQYTGKMTSPASATFKYEAIYNYQAKPEILPNTAGNNTNNQTFNITTDQAAMSHYDKQGADYLNMMGAAGYPVGGDVSVQGNNPSATFATGSIGFLAKIGVNYHFSPTFAISVMGYFESSGYNNDNTADYQLITPDWSGSKYSQARYYTTLLNGISKMSNNQASLRIGITHALFYNVSKWEARANQLGKTLTNEQQKLHGIQTDLMDIQQRLNSLKSKADCAEPAFFKEKH